MSREGGREGGKETRPSPILFLEDARDDEERERRVGEVLSVPMARVRARGRRIRKREKRQARRRGRCDRARAGRRDGRCGGTRERRASCSLARQSVPTAAQHTSTFSRLSFPFFTAVSPNHRVALRAALSFLFSGPRVLLFRSPSFRLSLSLVASRFDSRADRPPLYPVIRFFFSSASFFSFSRRLAFLHVQQDVVAISERGRVYIHAY